MFKKLVQIAEKCLNYSFNIPSVYFYFVFWLNLIYTKIEQYTLNLILDYILFWNNVYAIKTTHEIKLIL